jgi:hypothetical protein
VSARPAATVIGLLALGVAMNVHAAMSLGMHRVVPGWYVSAVPVALSTLGFGHVADYSALTGVRDVFEPHAGSLTSDGVNAGIRAVMNTPAPAIARDRYFIGTDDKGVVDLVTLSFSIFGYRAEGLLYTYFLILGLSTLVFAIHFRRPGWPLALAAALLAAHYAVLPAVGLNPQLMSVIAPRFISVLGMLACLHLIVAAGQRQVPRLVPIVCVAVQTAILAFVLHVRSAALWQFALAAACAGVIALAGLRRRHHAAAPTDGGLAGRRGVALAMWPVVLLVLACPGLMLYHRAAYAPEYFADHIDTAPGATIRSSSAGHVFWHSLFSGLAVHPRLAAEYRIRIDDVSVIRATGIFLQERGRVGEWAAMGGDSPGFRDMRYGRYDAAVREMLFTTCGARAAACLESVVRYKPALLAAYVGWFTGLRSNVPRPELLDETVQAQLAEMSRRMDRERRHVDYLRPAAVILLVAVGVLARSAVLSALVPLALCALALVLGALVPSLLVYPAAHTVGDALVALGLAVSLLIVCAAAWSAGAFMQRRPGRRTPPVVSAAMG